MAKEIKDDEGNVIKAGDVVSFAYGIPPVGVKAKVQDRNGTLWVLTPGHNPEEERLSVLAKYFTFYRLEPTTAKDGG